MPDGPDQTSSTAPQPAALAVLAVFRRGVYDCFDRHADGQFEVLDALTGADRPVRSIAELMLELVGQRGWGSFYQALNHGALDMAMARDLLAGLVRPARPGWPLLFAVDTSIVPRPDTTVVADVGMQFAERGVKGAVMVAPGWAMSWLCQVGELTAQATRTSWAPPVDVARVATHTTATAVAITQITALAARLPGHVAAGLPPPLFLADAGYCPITMTQHLPAGVQILVRLRSNRVFYGRPPARTGRRGAPAKHGVRFALREPRSWGKPDARHHHTQPGRVTVTTQAWHHQHPEPSNGDKQTWHGIVEGTLIRQETRRPGRKTQVRWLWWAGPADTFDLPILAEAYTHRFTIEHSFRFTKQDLFWTGHTPLDPAQAERWAWIVAFAYAQLHLARPLVADQPQRWQKPQPADQLSPRRVRRDFRRVCATLPSPTKPPKNTTPGPGRPKGSKNKHPRPLRPVIIKGKPAPTGRKPGRPRKHQPTEP